MIGRLGRWLVMALLAVLAVVLNLVVGTGAVTADAADAAVQTVTVTELATIYDTAGSTYDGSVRLLFAHGDAQESAGEDLSEPAGLAGRLTATRIPARSVLGFVFAAKDVAVTTARLQAHVDQAAGDYASGAIRMSAKQARAVGRNPNLAQTYRGQVIDSAVKDAVRGDSDLGHLWISRSGEFGPDFHDIVKNTWWDVTTPGQWLKHVNSFTEPFGSGIGVFTR